MQNNHAALHLVRAQQVLVMGQLANIFLAASADLQQEQRMVVGHLEQV